MRRLGAYALGSVALSGTLGLFTLAPPAVAAPIGLDFTGSEIEGASSSSGAPELTTEDVWVTDAPVGDQVRYFLLPREMPGSTLRVGGFYAPGQPSTGVELELLTLQDQSSCGSAYTYTGSGDEASSTVLSLGVDSRDSSNPSACLSSDGLLLAVSGSGSAEDAESFPLQLVVTEEPGVSAGGDLPAMVEEPVEWQPVPATGSAEQIEPGTSLQDSPELDDGLYAGTLRPGESQLFRVELDWGESLQTELRIPRLGEGAGIASSYAVSAGVELIDPTLNTATADSVDAEDSSLSSWTDIDPTAENRARATTAPVRYRNLGSDVDGVPGASVPGAYHVRVSASPILDDESDPDAKIDYELVVQRSGEAGAGAPNYTDGELRIGGTGGPDLLRLGTAAVLGGLGVASLGTSAVLLNRRRKSPA